MRKNYKIASIIRHEIIWAIQEQAEKILKIFSKADPVFVAINLDDFWIGMKG